MTWIWLIIGSSVSRMLPTCELSCFFFRIKKARSSQASISARFVARADPESRVLAICRPSGYLCCVSLLLCQLGPLSRIHVVPAPTTFYWHASCCSTSNGRSLTNSIGDSDDEFERFLAVLRFSFSKELKFIRTRLGKPYNSALGVFQFPSIEPKPPLIARGTLPMLVAITSYACRPEH